MVRGETEKKTNDLQARHFVARDLERYVRCTNTLKKRKKCAIEKPKLDNARKLRGIYFIDSEDEEFKNIMKNARRKLGIPMPAAMPCKTSVCSTKYACIVEADESLRKRKEGSLTRIMITLQEIGMNSLRLKQ